MTQDAHFLLLTHTKQLLLVTFCNTSAGIEVNFRTHGRTNGTDGRGSRNSYLDALKIKQLETWADLHRSSYSCLFLKESCYVRQPISPNVRFVQLEKDDFGAKGFSQDFITLE